MNRHRFSSTALVLAACTGASDAPPIPFGHLVAAPAGEFLHVSSFDTSGGNRDRLEVPPGDSAVILDLEGPGVIRRLWMTVASRDSHYLRRIALRAYWDGEEAPSIQAPLGDFFGNGFDRRHYTALPMGVSSGGFYSYLPMPFHRRARLVVENGTGRSIDALYFNIDVLRGPLDDDVGTLHAWWHRDARTDGEEPHVALDARGAGQFVGLSLNAESHANRLWYLEGDEVFVVDGSVRGQGTGTEDYFNGGWYFEHGEFAGPYHGLVVKDEARGRVAAYRWHVTDPIPFRESIRVTLEHGHGNEEVADYATVAYWYQREPHVPFAPLPPPDARRVLGVKIPPGAVVASDLRPAPSPGGASVLVPAPRPDRYEVVVYPLSAPEGTTVTFGFGDRRRTVAAGARDSATVLEPVSLGVSRIEDAAEIVVEAPPGYLPAAVWLAPVRRWAPEWDVVGTFPNPQRLGTEYSPAADSVYGPERDPSRDAYPLPGGGTGRWRRAAISPDGQVRLGPYFRETDWVSVFARAYLYSPDARDATLLFGADDAHVLWVNGDRVSQRQGRHISTADDLAVTVPLRPGWNRVLLHVANLDGGWAFQMRAADPDGALRWSPVPR